MESRHPFPDQLPANTNLRVRQLYLKIWHHPLRTREPEVNISKNKLYLLAILTLSIPMVVQARNAEDIVDVRFAPEAVNNHKIIKGDCYDSKVNCSVGKTFRYRMPKITDRYSDNTWIRVKTNGKVVRIKMGNLYAYLGEYCTLNFDAFLAGNICMRRRPQSPTAAPAPAIDP